MLKVGRKKLLIKPKKRKKRIVFSSLSSTFWTTEDIFCICCILYLDRESIRMGHIWWDSRKRETKNFSLCFFWFFKLLLYFEEWLLHRPALRSTWACVTHMKNLASLLTLGFVVVVVVYVWSQILSYWFLLYKRQDWSWDYQEL